MAASNAGYESSAFGQDVAMYVAPSNSSTRATGAHASSSAFSWGDEERQWKRTRLEPNSHSEDANMDMLVDYVRWRIGRAKNQ